MSTCFDVCLGKMDTTFPFLVAIEAVESTADLPVGFSFCSGEEKEEGQSD